jgi:hypothetical protein
MAGGRKIKSVSIPERLFDRVESIPNFTQFVVSALESDDGRAASAIEGRASDRRQHMDDLEDVLDELEIIRDNLKRIMRSPPSLRMRYLEGLVQELDHTKAAWRDHREDVRRRS